MAIQMHGDVAPAVGDRGAPAPGLAWRTVDLPVDARHAVEIGPRWRTRWLHFVVRTDGAPPADLSLYAPRIGLVSRLGVHRVLVVVNGHVADEAPLVAQHTWNRPWLFALPRALLRNGVNDVFVGVLETSRHPASVSSFWVGPLSELAHWHAARQWVQLTMPEVISGFAIGLGAFLVAVWAYRRDERAYLYFGIGAVVLFLRSLHYFVPREPFDERWFWWLTTNSAYWLVLALLGFTRAYFSTGARSLGAALSALGAGLALASLPGSPWAGQVVDDAVLLATVLAAGALTMLLTRLAFGPRARAALPLAATMWVTIGFGAFDFLLLEGLVSSERVYLMPYAAVFVFAAFGLLLVRRFVESIQARERMNVELDRRVREREAELAQTYERLADAERRQAVNGERSRLMREMHDGLGTTLITTLKLLQDGSLDRPAAAGVLRDCIEDLRLTIDSLEPLDHDPTTLLAMLRFRLGDRLRAAGLEVQWAVDQLPPLPWLEGASALHVLRIVQEVVSNAIKHADARHLRVETGRDATHAIVRIGDDGRGFNPARVPIRAGAGRGLAHIRQRAAEIGATLEIDSAPGRGTTVMLRLPLHPSAA